MKKTYLKIGGIAFFSFVADQVLKELAKAFLQTPLYLTDWWSFRYEQNFGIAWSIPVPRTILLIMNVVLLIVLPIFFARTLDLHQKKSQLLLGLLAGGALGNLFDRVFRGYVIDFFSVGRFPVFNLADALLCIGIFLIFVFYDKIKRNVDTGKV